jgi:probable HAF family extracellular repeat protein
VGQIVGFFNDATGGTHGFLTTDGTTFTIIDVPNATSTQAFGINNSGQIVGYFGSHGFVTDGTTLTTIDVPGAQSTQPRGINMAGQIVGTFSDTTGGLHGFLTDGTTFTTIDVPSATRFTNAFGINAVGQIVGFFGDSIGVLGVHGFLATPQVIADITPPVITVTASPTTLWSPNGQRVTVRVSGAITDTEPGDSGVQAGSAAYVVMDEYGQSQPSGNITLGASGSYSFTVALEASRRGNDQDGRLYTITVSAKDNAGNPGFKSTTVTVPHG